MKAGAQDYLMKDKLARLVPVVKRELAEAQMRRENKKNEEESLLLVQTVKSVRDCISITDLENNILFVNDSFLATYGFSEAELLGKNISIILSPMVSSEESKAVQSETMRDGWHGEIRNRRKNGTEFTVELWTSAVINSSGSPITMVGVARDITERKQAEKALRQSQESYRKLFEDHSAIKLVIDPDTGLILDANHAAAQYYGWTREELKQMKIEQINTLSAEEVKIEMEKARMHNRIQFEFRHRRADGSIRDVEVFSSKIEIGGKEVLHSIIHDITERKRIEKALSESQALYHSFVEHLPAGVFRKDSEGRYIFVNSYFCRLKGLKAVEILGKTPRELATYEAAIESSRTPEMIGTQRTLADLGTEHHKLIMSTGRSIELEEIYPQPDGTIRYYQIVKSPVFASDGKIIGTQGIQFDITERKKSEIELKESEERYRRLVEFSPDAIAVHSEGKIVYVNPAAITLLCANSASELIGKPFLDIIHPDYRESIHQQIIAVMKEEYAFPLTEQKFVRLDGSIVEVEVTALPIVYKEKSAMQIVARDISEQKKLQSQLLQTQKIQSIGTLAGGIAHDFNNILGIILAYSSLLNKSQLSPDKFANSITAINQAVQQGAALVRQILTFARKTDIVFQPMDISELIHELLSMLEQTFPKTITFSESIANNLPFIFGDRTQVHQALLNLCVNARDAMPDGGSISIAAGKHTREQMTQQFPAANEEAYVCLTVTDTGKGMNEATRLRVFDPFFTTKEKGKGTGLGLSVVYGVVEAHHGFIDLKSEPGRGTTFRLFFPVPTVNEQTIDTQQSTESFEIGGIETILFVEDEEMLMQMVSFLLESKGYSVLCARDGLEAVNIYQSHKQEIALVLTDMGLPVLTGSDEFKKLKEINPSVKVVFASGYFEPDVKSELLKDGANGFIQKPYEPDDVLRIIRKVLDQKA
jgi:PAS domain S-box-containing protein